MGVLCHAPSVKASKQIGIILSANNCTTCEGPRLVANNHYTFLAMGRNSQGDKVKFSFKNGIYIQNRISPAENPIDNLTLPEVFAKYLRANFEDYFATKDNAIKGWLKALMIGDTSVLQKSIAQSFSLLSLTHIIAVSGMHVDFVIYFLSFIFISPIQLLYISRIMSPNTWQKVRFFSRLFLFVCIVLFGYLARMPQSYERAMILFFVRDILASVHGPLNTVKIIFLTLFFQIIFYPVGFLSLSNVLSWSCYLLFTRFSRKISGRFWQRLKGQILTHAICYLFILGIFCLTKPWSILLNMLVVPLVPALFFITCCDYLLWNLGLNYLHILTEKSHIYFLSIILEISDYFARIDFLPTPSPDFTKWFQAAVLSFVLAMILMKLTKRTIS